jgi:hypothetical protein
MTRPPGRTRLLAIARESLRPLRGSALLALAGLLGMVCAELAAPWPLKIILDHVLLDKPLPESLAFVAPLLELGAWPSLAALAAGMAIIALFLGSSAYLQMYLTAKIGYMVVYRLRSALFSHLQRLSLVFHHRARTGELVTKVASDTNLLRELFGEWVLVFLGQMLTLVAMFGVMFMLNWRLALVVLATLPPLAFVLYRLNRSIKHSARDERRYEGRMASRLNEVLSSMALVQAFGRQGYEEDRFQSEIEDNLKSGIRAARASAAVSRSIALISALGTAITVLFGAAQVLDGHLTPGELLVFLAYVTRLYKPVRDLGRLSVRLSRAAVSVARIEDILAIQPEIEDAPDAIDAAPLAGEIVFEHVSFGYDAGRPVLEDVSHCAHRAFRRRQVDAPQPPAAALRALVGAHPDRRHRPAPLPARQRAPGDRHRAPGQCALRGVRAREHRLWQARRDIRGGRGRGALGACARVHRRPARGLRLGAGRARRHRVRGTAPAPVPRARAGETPADPGDGRADRVGRSRVGAPDPRIGSAAAAGQDADHDRARPVRFRGLRPGARAGERPHRRGRATPGPRPVPDAGSS